MIDCMSNTQVEHREEIIEQLKRQYTEAESEVCFVFACFRSYVNVVVSFEVYSPPDICDTNGARASRDEGERSRNSASGLYGVVINKHVVVRKSCIYIQIADTEAMINQLNDEVERVRTDKEMSDFQVSCYCYQANGPKYWN